MLVAVADAELAGRLRHQIGGRSDLVFLDATAYAAATAAALAAERPDLVLLDVRLPPAGGFAVIETVGAAEMPGVVFVSPLDHRALRALEIHALDYLLAPFDDDTLHTALDRARRYAEPFALEGQARRLERLVRGDEEGSRARRVVIKSSGQAQFVPLDEVRWVEGAGGYARLHLYDGRTHLLRESLSALAERFADDFFRIHRSTLVRSSEVAEVSHDEGEARVRLHDGTELRVSGVNPERLEPRTGGAPGRR